MASIHQPFWEGAEDDRGRPATPRGTRTARAGVSEAAWSGKMLSLRRVARTHTVPRRESRYRTRVRENRASQGPISNTEWRHDPCHNAQRALEASSGRVHLEGPTHTRCACVSDGHSGRDQVPHVRYTPPRQAPATLPGSVRTAAIAATAAACTKSLQWGHRSPRIAAGRPVGRPGCPGEQLNRAEVTASDGWNALALSFSFSRSLQQGVAFFVGWEAMR